MDYTPVRLRNIPTENPSAVDATTQPDNCLLGKNNIDNNRSCRRRAIWKRSRDVGVELEPFQ